jgi:LemA protein
MAPVSSLTGAIGHRIPDSQRRRTGVQLTLGTPSDHARPARPPHPDVGRPEMSLSAAGGIATIVGGLVCLLLVAVVLWLVFTYNKLVRQRNQVDASWAQIDVQLKRRHDLIPNLVETVKGYAAHEKSTLDAVISARAGAVAASGADPATRAEAETAVSQTLGRLFALAEAYPNLKANTNFLALQSELGNTEDKIAYARQFYNSAVQSFNNSTQTIPTNLIAGMMGLRTKTFFETAESERGPVQVRF